MGVRKGIVFTMSKMLEVMARQGIRREILLRILPAKGLLIWLTTMMNMIIPLKVKLEMTMELKLGKVRWKKHEIRQDPPRNGKRVKRIADQGVLPIICPPVLSDESIV